MSIYFYGTLHQPLTLARPSMRSENSAIQYDSVAFGSRKKETGINTPQTKTASGMQDFKNLTSTARKRLQTLTKVCALKSLWDTVDFALKIVEYLAKATVAGYKLELVKNDVRYKIPLFSKIDKANVHLLPLLN